ncbi:ABC transporter permease subunit [Paenibacillus polymyxa]|uniref:Antibiotic transport system permease protein n=1 Tax=Paenibacillus polymyxa TaxID=1406 RepID=A0A378Y6L7_PAEPO|nr:ABC transporter permease [Paenibacillus polymyxa]MBE7899564.1 ABC transporter permease [Paenibacillus polymyxa]MBG9762286.1 antibiotic transport system permease [Paenibacillus polymyxa]MCC3258747.1 ABC transporter permease [Paenibacillus polymyxa]QPK52894.1 ABC transporter permease subunit [Paenibacillus polymyxa]QPK57974.1 ABC transporter permease subunit [Paenibacillus polymyxa]
MIRAELIKLKGSKAFLLSYIILLAVVLLEFALSAIFYRYSIDRLGWVYYFTNIDFLVNIAAGFISYYILTGHIFAREYQENTHIFMFTTPVTRVRFYFSKLIIIYGFIIVSLFIVLFLSAVLGMFITNRPLTMAIWVYQIQVFAKMCVMHAMLIPVASFFAIRWKSIMVVVLVVCTVIFLNFMYKSEWYPWIIPYLLSPNEGSAIIYVNTLIAWLSLSITFLLGLFLSLWAYQRRN